MKGEQMYRQGDVLLMKSDRPTGVLRQRDNGVILEGEITGHSHRLTAGAVMDAPNGEVFVSAERGAEIVHEEHATITIPEGWYRVIRQREYDEKEIRYVRD
jgi:hypothetical protein